MKILNKLSQNRRDFWADYQCETCGFIDENQSGYDDAYFHNTVIPEMKCPKCNVSSNAVTSTPSIPPYLVM